MIRQLSRLFAKICVWNGFDSNYISMIFNIVWLELAPNNIEYLLESTKSFEKECVVRVQVPCTFVDATAVESMQDH